MLPHPMTNSAIDVLSTHTQPHSRSRHSEQSFGRLQNKPDGHIVLQDYSSLLTANLLVLVLQQQLLKSAMKLEQKARSCKIVP